MGVFSCIFSTFSGQGSRLQRIMVDATHLKMRRTAANPFKKAMSPILMAVQEAV